jgi:hypothetical protein
MILITDKTSKDKGTRDKDLTEVEREEADKMILIDLKGIDQRTVCIMQTIVRLIKLMEQILNIQGSQLL